MSDEWPQADMRQHLFIKVPVAERGYYTSDELEFIEKKIALAANLAVAYAVEEVEQKRAESEAQRKQASQDAQGQGGNPHYRWTPNSRNRAPGDGDASGSAGEGPGDRPQAEAGPQATSEEAEARGAYYDPRTGGFTGDIEPWRRTI